MDNALAAVLAHELRRSLTSILGCAGTLELDEDRLTPAERGDILRHIADRAGHLVRLAGNLVAVSRAPATTPTSVSLDAVIQQAVAEATDRYPLRRVRTDVGTGLHARMDAGSLHVVVLNLVANALRFAAPGSRVDVSAHPDGVWIALTVANVGPPIAPADRERVFEPFVAGVTAGDPGPGLGYGLYAVRCLLQAHGGDVAVESGAQEVAFTGWLRAAAPAFPVGRAPQREEAAGARPAGARAGG